MSKDFQQYNDYNDYNDHNNDAKIIIVSTIGYAYPQIHTQIVTAYPNKLEAITTTLV